MLEGRGNSLVITEATPRWLIGCRQKHATDENSAHRCLHAHDSLRDSTLPEPLATPASLELIDVGATISYVAYNLFNSCCSTEIQENRSGISICPRKFRRRRCLFPGTLVKGKRSPPYRLPNSRFRGLFSSTMTGTPVPPIP